MKKLLLPLLAATTLSTPAYAGFTQTDSLWVVFGTTTPADLVAIYCNQYMPILDADTNTTYRVNNCFTPVIDQVYPVPEADVVGLTSALSGKQTANSALTEYAAFSLGNGKLMMRDDLGNLYGSTITELGQDLMAAADPAAMKTVLFTGTTAQYVQGDGSNATFPTIPTTTSQLTNNSGFLTSVPVSSVAGKVGAVTLATGDIATGTFADGRIAQSNVTQWQAALAIGQSQVTGLVTALSGKEPTLTKGNLAETTSSVLAITGGTGAVIGSGSTIQVKQASASQSGYLSSTDWSTFNAKQDASARTFAITSPTLNATGSQISTTRDAQVTCTVDITVSSLLLGSAAGNSALRYADNSGMSTNLVTVATGRSSTGGILSLVNLNTVTLSGIIPAGKYRQLTSASTSGTATFSTPSCQEVLL